MQLSRVEVVPDITGASDHAQNPRYTLHSDHSDFDVTHHQYRHCGGGQDECGIVHARRPAQIPSCARFRH